MSTTTKPRRRTGQGISPDKAIQAAADAIDDGSLPELRDRIDAVYSFLVEEFIPDGAASQVIGSEDLEVSRLAQKLEALRERLIYADFGPRELRALRETLEDLHWIIATRWPPEPVQFAALPGWIGG